MDNLLGSSEATMRAAEVGTCVRFEGGKKVEGLLPVIALREIVIQGA